MWIELKICCEKQTTCTTLLFVSNKQIGVFIFVQHQHRFVSKTENPKKSNKKSKSRNTQQKFQNENPASDSIFKKTAAAEHIGNVIFFCEISGKKKRPHKKAIFGVLQMNNMSVGNIAAKKLYENKM